MFLTLTLLIGVGAVAAALVVASAGASKKYGLTSLEPRERYVLARLYGLDGKAADTFAGVGSQLGLSREAVRQIHGKALTKLPPIAMRQLTRGRPA